MISSQPPVELPDGRAEHEDEAGGMTRAGLFRMLAASGAGAVGLGLLTSGPALAAATPGTQLDLTILEYALTLEYLGAAFYESALQHARLSGEAHEVALLFRGHERAHVAFVRKTIASLGGRPHPSERFEFGSATRSRLAFLRTSAALEEMCVETLNGAGPLVTTQVLIGASELVSVEARQAAWVRAILGRNPAPVAFTPALTAAQSQARLRATGFVH